MIALVFIPELDFLGFLLLAVIAVVTPPLVIGCYFIRALINLIQEMWSAKE